MIIDKTTSDTKLVDGLHLIEFVGEVPTLISDVKQFNTDSMQATLNDESTKNVDGFAVFADTDDDATYLRGLIPEEFHPNVVPGGRSNQEQIKSMG